MTTILKITDSDEKAHIVEYVLSDLPEWFGLPESTAEYIHDSRELDLWAAKDNGEYIGFITLSQSSTDCGEIHCMGVKKAYHRKGVGTLLLEALKNFRMESMSCNDTKVVCALSKKSISFLQSFSKNSLYFMDKRWYCMRS